MLFFKLEMRKDMGWFVQVTLLFRIKAKEGVSSLKTKGEFLGCTGSSAAGEDFLAEYRRAVLLVLKKEGLLDDLQLEKCKEILERQYQ